VLLVNLRRKKGKNVSIFCAVEGSDKRMHFGQAGKPREQKAGLFVSPSCFVKELSL
jgi:hypothetical protein